MRKACCFVLQMQGEFLSRGFEKVLGRDSARHVSNPLAFFSYLFMFEGEEAEKQCLTHPAGWPCILLHTMLFLTVSSSSHYTGIG